MTPASFALQTNVARRVAIDAGEAERTTESDVGIAQRLYEQAESAWKRELLALTGSYDARHTKQGQGSEGSQLRALFDAFVEAANHFNAVDTAYRSTPARHNRGGVDPDDLCTECDAPRGSCRACQAEHAADQRAGD